MAKKQIGLIEGKLAPLSHKPNSVSTQTEQQDKLVSPLKAESDLGRSIHLIKKALSSMKEQNDIELIQDNYIHVIFTTKIMKYKDDVEFLIDQDAGLIHFKSASRKGYSDLGKNKKRYLKFKSIYESLSSERS